MGANSISVIGSHKTRGATNVINTSLIFDAIRYRRLSRLGKVQGRKRRLRQCIQYTGSKKELGCSHKTTIGSTQLTNRRMVPARKISSTTSQPPGKSLLPIKFFLSLKRQIVSRPTTDLSV